MRKPQPDEFETLKRIAKSADGRVLLKFLHANHLQTMEASIDGPEGSAERLRGRAQEARDIWKLLNDAQQQQP